MSRTSVSLPALTSASNGDEVERDGIVYKFDSSIGSSGQWQTVLNRNLTVVTKNNDQSYFAQTDGAVSVSKKANDSLLNINEVDGNVVNLKRSELTFLTKVFSKISFSDEISEFVREFKSFSRDFLEFASRLSITSRLYEKSKEDLPAEFMPPTLQITGNLLKSCM